MKMNDTFNKYVQNLTEARRRDGYWSRIKAVIEEFPTEVGQLVLEDLESGRENWPVLIDIASELANPFENLKVDLQRGVESFVSKVDVKTLHEDELISFANLLGFVHQESKDILKLISISQSKSNAVRLAATRSLISCLDHSQERDGLVVARLLDLADDKDNEVRGWALFGLAVPVAEIKLNGTMLGRINQKLISHLTDKDDARDEAIIGLACRERPEGLNVLKKILSGRKISPINIEAAGVYANPSLLPALEKIAGLWEGDALLLDWALKRCSPDETVRESVDSRF